MAWTDEELAAGRRVTQPQGNPGGGWTDDQLAAGRPAVTYQPAGAGEIILRQGLGQGLAMGFGDEAEAGLRTGFGLWGDYGERLGQIRSRNSEVENRQPGAAIAAQIAGGVVPVVGAALAAPVTGGASGAAAVGTGARLAGQAGRLLSAGDTAISRALSPIQQRIAAALPGRLSRGAAQGSAAGAAYGTVQGFGEGEGGLMNRLESGLGGMAVGAGTGLVLGGGVAAAGPVVRDLLMPGARRGELDTANLLREPPQASVRFQDDAGNATELNVPQASIDLINLRGAASRLGIEPPPATLADMSGEGTSLFARQDSLLASRTPQAEEARTNLRTRLEDQPQRVERAFAGAFDLVPQSLFDVRQGAANGVSGAGRLFDSVREVGEVSAPGVAEVVSRLPRAVLSAADEIARAQGSRTALVDRDGNLTRTPTATELLAINDALVDRVDSLFRTGDGNRARTAKNERNALLRAMDEAIPGFADARASYATANGISRAVELGAKAFERNVEASELRFRLAGMSADERAAFADAALARLRLTGSQTNQGRQVRMDLSPENLDRLRAILDGIGRGEFADDLTAVLSAERAVQVSTTKANSNSLTAQRSMDALSRRLRDNPLEAAGYGGVAAGLPLAAAIDTAGGLGLATGGLGLAAIARGASQRRAEAADSAALNMLADTNAPAALARVINADGLRRLNDAQRRLAATPGIGTARAGSTLAGMDGLREPWSPELFR